MATGIPLKFAIGISSLQMTTSALFGTFFNKKSSDLNFIKYWKIGAGGIFGGFIGAQLVDSLDSQILGYFFIALLIFAIIKVLIPNKVLEKKTERSDTFLFFLGVGIGSISSMLGVGGGILLIPILVSLLGYTTKEASIIALFFVIFTATISFVTLSYLEYVDFTKGAVIAIASILGVKLGILFRDKISKELHKRLVIILYSILLIIFTYKLEIF